MSKATKTLNSTLKKKGRPSIRSLELIEIIFARIIQGDSVRKICSDKSMPSQDTFYRWTLTDPDFSEKYSIARQIRADRMMDECLVIADEQLQGNNIDTPIFRQVSRQILRIKTRQWQIGRMAPRR